MRRACYSLFSLVFFVFLTACGPAPTPTEDAMQHLVETQSAIAIGTMKALSATKTELARPTLTPTITLTPQPSATSTSTPGPLVIDDDFSTLNPRWQGCTVCTIKDGKLLMGPYPSSDSAEGYIALCNDCGIVHEYKMSVDATFISGVSDRGFGFVLREQKGDFIDLEITTWQLYGVWFYDSKGGRSWTAWRALISKGFAPSAYLNPALITNHIDVEVKASESNVQNDLIKIAFNGTVINTIEVPRSSGHIGLAVGLHSIGVAFDNFHFEGEPLSTPEAGTSG